MIHEMIRIKYMFSECKLQVHTWRFNNTYKYIHGLVFKIQVHTSTHKNPIHVQCLSNTFQWTILTIPT